MENKVKCLSTGIETTSLSSINLSLSNIGLVVENVSIKGYNIVFETRPKGNDKPSHLHRQILRSFDDNQAVKLFDSDPKESICRPGPDRNFVVAKHWFLGKKNDVWQLVNESNCLECKPELLYADLLFGEDSETDRIESATDKKE